MSHEYIGTAGSWTIPAASDAFARSVTVTPTVTPGDATLGSDVVVAGCAAPGPLAEARSFVTGLADRALAKRTETLLDVIQRHLDRMAGKGLELGALPPLRASMWEDGCVSLEWVARSFRVGFNVGDDPSDATWYLASTRQHGGPGADGPLGRDPNGIVAILVRFVVENT
jgi:hypothetical protein